MKCQKFIELAQARGIRPRLIFDLGSYDAAQALELHAAFPEARVLCLEADPEHTAKILERIEKHRNKVAFLSAALGPWDGVIDFYHSTGPNPECGSLLRPNKAYPEPMPYAPILVPCVTAGTLIAETGPPDLVWMDVQGREMDFFNHLRGENFPALVWMEVCYRAYYQDQMLAGETTARLRALGYSKVFECQHNDWFGDACYELGP